MSFYNQEKRFNYSIDNKINEKESNEEKINKLEEKLNNINDQLLIITELLGNINNIVSFRYSVAPFGKGYDQDRQIVTIPYELNYYKFNENNPIKNGFNLN